MRELKKISENRKDKKVLIKMTIKEHQQLKKQAEKYTNGNLSDWLRYSGMLEPKREDIKVKP
jgi:hypothetical protein